MSGGELNCKDALPLLIQGASAMGLSLPASALRRFERYCSFLLERNQQLNLTAIRSPDGVMRTLFLDSLTLLLAIPPEQRSSTMKVVDVGAGGGFPGIPLCIVCPSWRVVLIESIGKKARFLSEVAEHLGLQHVSVLSDRAEEIGAHSEQRDSADICTARAVASLPVLIELCAPLVRPGGSLVFPKSGDVEAEIHMASRAAGELRAELQSVVTVPPELGLGEGRVIVVYRKSGPTPRRFPRRVGMARKEPILPVRRL